MGSTSSSVLPWQESQWSLIQSMISNDRLPHALLITGVKGTGIQEFATKLAASVLCEQTTETGENCQSCAACHLIKASTHPDLLLVSPEEEGKAIKVDQIRKLVGFSQLQNHYNQRKVIIISPAEAMNISSANSLLKTLEEPPGDTLIILVSHQPSSLPITVRSRCQKMKVSASSVHVREWLEGKVEPELIETVLASGCGPLFSEGTEEAEQIPDRSSLLEDLEYLAYRQQDPVEVADKWSKKQADDTFFWLLKICQDMVKLKLDDKVFANSNNSLKLVNQDMIKKLTILAEKYDLKGIFQIHDKLFNYHKLVSANTNLKAATMLEDFTIEWVRLSKR